MQSIHMTCCKNVKRFIQTSGCKAAVKLLSCDHEVTGLSPGNGLLQKCRERLRTQDPAQAGATCTGLSFFYLYIWLLKILPAIIVLDALSVWYDGSLMQRDGCRLVAPMWSRLTRLTGQHDISLTRKMCMNYPVQQDSMTFSLIRKMCACQPI